MLYSTRAIDDARSRSVSTVVSSAFTGARRSAQCEAGIAQPYDAVVSSRAFAIETSTGLGASGARPLMAVFLDLNGLAPEPRAPSRFLPKVLIRAIRDSNPPLTASHTGGSLQVSLLTL